MDNDDEDIESSESLESRLVLFSENKQDFSYSDENINEPLKKVRKLVTFLNDLNSSFKPGMQYFKYKLNLKKERTFHYFRLQDEVK